jgi:hypothetical protein
LTYRQHVWTDVTFQDRKNLVPPNNVLQSIFSYLNRKKLIYKIS